MTPRGPVDGETPRVGTAPRPARTRGGAHAEDHRQALPEPDVAAMAKRAVARVAKLDPSGPDRVSLTVAVVMSRDQLEALTARAIREGKPLRGLINELLAAAADGERR